MPRADGFPSRSASRSCVTLTKRCRHRSGRSSPHNASALEHEHQQRRAERPDASFPAGAEARDRLLLAVAGAASKRPEARKRKRRSRRKSPMLGTMSATDESGGPRPSRHTRSSSIASVSRGSIRTPPLGRLRKSEGDADEPRPTAVTFGSACRVHGITQSNSRKGSPTTTRRRRASSPRWRRSGSPAHVRHDRASAQLGLPVHRGVLQPPPVALHPRVPLPGRGRTRPSPHARRARGRLSAGVSNIAPRAGTQLRSPLAARCAANPCALPPTLSPAGATVFRPDRVLPTSLSTQSVSTDGGGPEHGAGGCRDLPELVLRHEVGELATSAPVHRVAGGG